MTKALMPGWMQGIARYNPLDWAVLAGREGLAAGPDWSLVFTRMGWLLIFTIVCAWLATRAFRVPAVHLSWTQST